LKTELGRIAESVTGSSGAKTPLVERMERFSQQLAWLFVGASVVLGVIAYAQGYPLNEVFMMAVALAVAAIPEGLPIAMTVALSIGSRRMSQRNVIVRKLMAVEGLGSCTYIASDKTGTLTLNRQTVKQIALPDGQRFDVSGEGYNGDGNITGPDKQTIDERVEANLESLVRCGSLANEGYLTQKDGDWESNGDAMDVALLALAYKHGLDPERLRHEANTVFEVPYDSARQYSARAWRDADGSLRLAVKGSAERLLPYCRASFVEGESVAFDQERIFQLVEELSSEGYRVLALAEASLDENTTPEDFGETTLPDLMLLGFVGMIDPIRPEAPAAIDSAHESGIKVAMVTGDHPKTALAIARQLGIAHGDNAEVLTGVQLTELGDNPEEASFRDKVSQVSVFARVSPLQKLHIIKALQQTGHYVAVTGDGVNDTPALRQANIGVAMGSGSDVAKDTAAIIITDDNFASIEAGVEEGRFAYANVRKVIFLVLSTGIAEVLLMTLSLILALPMPLFAVQLLWLNIVTNGIQDVALAFESGEKGVLKQPPKNPEQGIFDAMMVQQNIVSGLTMALVTLAAWWWFLDIGYEEARARNLIFLLLVLMENIHAFNARSELQSVFKVPLQNNWILVFGVLAAQGLHILALYVPFLRNVLGTQPVTPLEWLELLAMASSLLITMEVFKAIKRRQLKSIRPQEVQP
jgi:potassium/sodium efflux P-type ATPase